MAKTKKCPICAAKTRSNFWSSKQTVVVNARGEQVFHAGGQVALGFAMRKCSNCSWLGDFVVTPLPPAPAPKSTYVPTQADIDDDYDEDYINHYYH